MNITHIINSGRIPPTESYMGRRAEKIIGSETSQLLKIPKLQFDLMYKRCISSTLLSSGTL